MRVIIELYKTFSHINLVFIYLFFYPVGDKKMMQLRCRGEDDRKEIEEEEEEEEEINIRGCEVYR